MQLKNTIDISNKMSRSLFLPVRLFNDRWGGGGAIAMQKYVFFTLLACQRRIYSLFGYVLTVKHVTKCNNNPNPLK